MRATALGVAFLDAAREHCRIKQLRKSALHPLELSMRSVSIINPEGGSSCSERYAISYADTVGQLVGTMQGVAA